ncbi:MAG: prenyltransferase [Gemmatimonadaceae bacterium]|nr:prenyltransferase [Gloeobacterales cyanobacterium ES-bin-141]
MYLLQILRAPFFSASIAPILIGTLCALLLGQSFSFWNLLATLLVGVGVHAGANVSNDVFDFESQADVVNENRSPFNGGSGVLIAAPSMLGQLRIVYVVCYVVAILATTFLLVQSPELRLPLMVVIGLGFFLSFFYTAPPFQLAYRGLGDISVFLSFGPLLTLLGALGQGAWVADLTLLASLPLGLQITAILWISCIADVPGDLAARKYSLVSRLGTARSCWGYALLQFGAIAALVPVALALPGSGWLVLGAALPPLFFLSKVLPVLWANHDRPRDLVPALAGTVQLHLSGAVSYVLLLGLVYLRQSN